MYTSLTVDNIWAAVQAYAGIAGVGTLMLAVGGYAVMKRLLRWGTKKI